MAAKSDVRRRVNELLAGLNTGADVQATLEKVLEVVSESSGCDSVGIRWKAGEDYPYFVTRGFGRDFLVREGPLCERDAAGLVLRQPDGSAQLACLCGAVVSGNTDTRWPFFTKGGSFWTNTAPTLRPELNDRDLGFRVRGYCIEVGYEVVAVIPLKTQGTIYGVLQMNCREAGNLTIDSIEEYEDIGADIAAAVSSVMEEQAA